MFQNSHIQNLNPQSNLPFPDHPVTDTSKRTCSTCTDAVASFLSVETKTRYWDKCEDAFFSANERSEGEGKGKERRKGKEKGKGKLVDVACLGGSMVEHQPRLLGSRVRFPAGAFAIFSVPAKASLPIPFLLSLSPFLSLSLSLRPFVCAKNKVLLELSCALLNNDNYVVFEIEREMTAG